MNIIVNSQLLAAELRLLNKVVPTKPAIAILSHALMRADGDNLHLYATDLEVGLSTRCPARVTEPGVVALPVGKLLALVEQFPDADVSITIDKAVVVRCGAFTSRLQALSARDFPQPPDVSGTTAVLDAEVLRSLISRTRYAINATASKFVLQGALLTLSGDVAAMVATDSKRLALATGGRPAGPDVRIIVPMKTLDVLTSQPGHGEITVTVGDKHLFFASGGKLLTSRTMESQFPAYERIIPRNNDKVIIAGRVELTAALRRVALVSEENRAIYLDVGDGRVALSSSSAEVGSADEEVHVEYSGPPLKVCANGSYMLDFMAAATGQAVTILLKDALSAMLMADGVNYVGVVMLMRR